MQSRRIDTASFTEKNIIAKATFDDRPSTANQQKRSFASRVEKFVDQATPAPYTDITGGLLQAIEFLNEKQTARKEILIFSDMKEDLAKGYVRDHPARFQGIRRGRAQRDEASLGQLRSAPVPR